MATFTAQLEEFAKLTKRNMLYVASESIQDVVEAAHTPQVAITKGATSFEEGKIPVADADLTNSLTTDGTKGAESYSTAIAGFEIGDVMEFAWSEEYAYRIELGFTGTDSLGRKYDVPGRHFVGANAKRFQEFVENRVAEVSK